MSTTKLRMNVTINTREDFFVSNAQRNAIAKKTKRVLASTQKQTNKEYASQQIKLKSYYKATLYI